jgi:hypothetical protein
MEMPSRRGSIVTQHFRRTQLFLKRRFLPRRFRGHSNWEIAPALTFARSGAIPAHSHRHGHPCWEQDNSAHWARRAARGTPGRRTLIDAERSARDTRVRLLCSTCHADIANFPDGHPGSRDAPRWQACEAVSTLRTCTHGTAGRQRRDRLPAEILGRERAYLCNCRPAVSRSIANPGVVVLVDWHCWNSHAFHNFVISLSNEMTLIPDRHGASHSSRQ